MPPSGAIVERVRDARAFGDWALVVGRAFEDEDFSNGPSVRAGLGMGFGDDVAFRHYLCRIDGAPVGASTLSLGARVAGLANIATVPEHRGRGIAVAVAGAALEDARALGLRIGVLSADRAGIRVYEKLGLPRGEPPSHVRVAPHLIPLRKRRALFDPLVARRYVRGPRPFQEDPSMRARLVRTALLLGVAALGVGCTKTLDTTHLQSQLQSELQSDLGSPDLTLHCPGSVKVQAGSTFTCTATGPGGESVTLLVTQKDAQGHVTSKISGASGDLSPPSPTASPST